MDKIKILLLNDKAIVVYSKILRSILAIGITYVIFRMITALAKKLISKNKKTSDDRKMKTVTSVIRSLFKYLFYILVFRVSGDPRPDPFRRILCEHDDRMVLRHGACKAMGVINRLHSGQPFGCVDA